jgi:hypothetical protein
MHGYEENVNRGAESFFVQIGLNNQGGLCRSIDVTWGCA